MDKQQIKNSSYLDILFDGKNKDYGAYQLRKDYNRRMGIAILAGALVVALFFIITGATSKDDSSDRDLMTREILMEDVNTEKPKDEPPPPPPPPVEPPPPVRAQVKFTPPVIKKDNEIIKNETIKNEDLENKDISNNNVAGQNKTQIIEKIDFTEGQKTEIEKTEVTKKVDNTVYDVVQQEPGYPGGLSQVPADVSKNFVYPQIAIENGISGRVIVRFVVEKDGSVSNVEVVRGLGYGLDEAAVAAVKKIKKFTPAKQNGVAVRYRYSIPVICQIQ